MNKELLNIEDIQKSMNNKNVYWTRHCLNRINQRHISILDIKTAINNGSIIEIYYDDYPYPSCLILGKDNNNKIIHIVCAIANGIVHMITAYHPDRDKWEDDMKRREE